MLVDLGLGAGRRCNGQAASSLSDSIMSCGVKELVGRNADTEG